MQPNPTVEQIAETVTLNGTDYPIRGRIVAGADAFVDAFIANFRTGVETGASAAFW